MIVYNKLKSVRGLLSLNQKEIEDVVGLSQRDISLLENGKKKFIPIEYIQFLNKKSIPLDLLFDDDVNLSEFEKRLSGKLSNAGKNTYPNTYPDTLLTVENHKGAENSVINHLFSKIDEKDSIIKAQSEEQRKQAEEIGALRKELELFKTGFISKSEASTVLYGAEAAQTAHAPK